MMDAGRPVITDEELLKQCTNNFYLTATIQGRLAYLFMSIHAVNPSIFASMTKYNPTHLFLSNMLYGTAVHLFARPSMSLIGFVHRLSFSVLGSMMFNYSTLQVYEWLVEKVNHRPFLLTFLGFLSGRIMIVHLLAYLYHVDSRCVRVGETVHRDPAYETMYP